MQTKTIPTLFNPVSHGRVAGQLAFHRCFFLYGNIHDEFCTPDCQVLDIERLLHRHLQELGFEQIIAYHGSDKFYCFDLQTWQRIQNRTNSEQKQSNSSPPTPATPSRNLVAGGPLGHKKIGSLRQSPLQSTQGDRKSTGIASQKGRYPLFQRMSDTDAVPYLNHLITNSQIRTALIVVNLHDLVLNVNEDARRHMVNNLERWQKLGSENHNIILFLIPFKGMEPLQRAMENHPQWRILENMIFSDAQNRTLGGNVIPIGSPRIDEIRNVLNRERLLRKLPVEWTEFEQLSCRMGRQWLNLSEHREGRKLDVLLRALCHVKEISSHGLVGMVGEQSSQPALQRLQNMRGLEVVGDRVKSIIRRVTASLNLSVEARDKTIPQNMPDSPISLNVQRLQPRSPNKLKGENLHIALAGRPGTGKTTSARLIAEAYREAGLLESGHIIEVTREDLVAGYVGQTAIQTAQYINEAMGGVLFIDEVQRFAGQESGADFGREAIQTLLGAMENHKGEFAVIVATYPDQMTQFLAIDPGLSRRFSAANTIHIPDYTPEVLEYIFRQLVTGQQLTLSEELDIRLKDFFHNWYVDRNPESFGNAGDVRDLLFNGMKERRLERIESDNLAPTDHAWNQLVPDDIPPSLKQNFRPARSDNADIVMQELNQLIGMSRVKKLVTERLQHLQVQQLRGQGINLAPGHYIFTGNPGTGKTTVARLMGRIFRSLGLLKRGHVVEVTRADLVAGYSGQTAEKTRKKIQEAFDGILFIDEAYQLNQEHGTDYFGRESIETLMADMDNERHRLCVIAAGYPTPMQRLIESNPGLPSRFGAIVPFDDYSAKELVMIFKLQAQSAHLTLADGLEEALIEVFSRMIPHRDERFGNGREVRKLLEKLQTCQNARILRTRLEDSKKVMDQHFLHQLTVEDIPPEITLQELLEGVTSDNLHTETDTGEVVGNEAW